MAARAKRRGKQRQRAGRIALANSVGSDLPLPPPPNFGQPKFTPEQQAQNPEEPMTRVIKDVARVGVWKSGFGPDGQATSEQFDEAALRQMLANARHYMRRYDINLGKGHGDDDLVIHSDDLIAPCDDLILENGVLWGSFYCTPEQAKYLRNPAMKTSPGLVRNYRAGDMTVYPGLSAVHFAVTDRPVIGGQGRFLALTNWICPKAKTRRVAPKSVAFSNKVQAFRARFRGRNIMPRAIALANSLSQGAGKMEIGALVAALNVIFAALGMGQLGEDTNETNIVGRLEGLGMALGGEASSEPSEPENPDPGGAPTDPTADPNAGVVMSNRLFGRFNKLIEDRFKAFESSMKPIVSGAQALLQSQANAATEAKKAAYMTFRNKLGTGDGKTAVAEAVLAAKDKLAEKLDWDPSVLDGLHPTITMSNATKAGATEDPPIDKSKDGGGDALSDEAMRKRLAARGIDPNLMPTG